MTKTRLILFGLFITIFTTAAPIILLYANGWRFDIDERKLVQTGAIFLNMNVREAKIFLNNNLEETTSPLSTSILLNNILPGIKKIRIEKERFNSWEKEMRIDPQKTSRFLNVLLLPNEPKNETLLAQTQKNPMTNFSISTDENLIALQHADGKIALWDRNNKEFLQGTLHDLPNVWSPDSNFFLVPSPDGHRMVLYRIRANAIQQILDMPRLRNPKIIIDNGTFIVGTMPQQGNTLLNLVSVKIKNDQNPSTETKEIVHTIQTYDATQNGIYFIDQAYILWKIKADGSSLQQISQTPLAATPEQTIELTASASGNNFAIRTVPATTKEQNGGGVGHEGSTWIFNLHSKQFDIVTSNVQLVRFSPDEEKMLLVTSHELYVYFIKETFNPRRTALTLELITRLSGEIKNAWWHAQNEHILFMYNNGLRIIELDNRGERNGGELLNGFLIAKPLPSGHELLALDQEQLYASPIPRIEGLLAF